MGSYSCLNVNVYRIMEQADNHSYVASFPAYFSIILLPPAILPSGSRNTTLKEGKLLYQGGLKVGKLSETLGFT